MIIPCQVNEIEQVRPSTCKCKKSRLHRHGSYQRVVSGEIAICFFCRCCKTHVTIIPATCVPYKHHPASTIEHAIEGRLAQDTSGPALTQQLWVCASTIGRWVKEFSGHLSVLATEGARRLEIRPLSGAPQQIYQKLKQHYGGDHFLCRFQVDLCRDFPPLGIFRPLILNSG